MSTLTINGHSLTIEQVILLAHTPELEVKIAPDAVACIERAARAVQNFVQTGQIAYGITTGFGAFKDRLIPLDEVERLQENIILSHAVGVGPVLDDAEVRAMMLIRANTLCQGHSGIQLKTVQLLLDLLNRNILPVIPSKGSLGASGDLAPLAHMSLPLIGRGFVRVKGETVLASEALLAAGLAPVKLAAKEGLALTNGTTLMTALGVLAVNQAETLLGVANCAAALCLEAQNGTLRAFDDRIHQGRPQAQQRETAAQMRALLSGSTLTRPDDPCNVQDAYTLRCIPQVHGAVHSALDYVRKVLTTELNSVTDNPLLFFDETGQVDIISGGNFHGEPLALALDFLSLAMTDLGNMSERRTAKLIDSKPEGGYYPAFLTPHGGTNSGFMLLQYTAAALTSENKTLAHPASLDSIPSSGNVEDHVSMGANAALHCRQVLENLTVILAIELMSASQAVDFRLQAHPELHMGQGTDKVYGLLRMYVPFFAEDTYFQPFIERTVQLIKAGHFDA